jgi:hypothetical protein
MGLDIIAYKGLTLVKSNVPPEEYDDNWEKYQQYLYIYEVEGFANCLPPLEVGCLYDCVDTFSFRAGSYSGYNHWREQLSLVFLGEYPRTIWDDPHSFNDKPFVELINFSDCEGILGTNVCQKLLSDFRTAVKDIKLLPGQAESLAIDNRELDYFIEKFYQWLKAFEYGADEGCVYFC